MSFKTHIAIDYSERDRERRFKILEGVNWDLDKARMLLQWVDIGHTSSVKNDKPDAPKILEIGNAIRSA